MSFLSSIAKAFTEPAVGVILTLLAAGLCIIALTIFHSKEKDKANENNKKTKKAHRNKVSTADAEPSEDSCGFLAKYYKYIVIAVLIVGVLIRFSFFWIYPLGLNQDEASVTYDTYADLEYGFDRNGDHNPVYSVAWGSGHSSLYITFSKPFIALFGLNMFTARIVNALFGCLALFAFYGISKRIFKKRGALISTLIFAIAPWHIMMSRWALECNLFPSVFIIATYFLVRGFEKQWFYVPSLLFYSLSLYAYGTSYMIVPVFVVIMAIYLIVHKKITWKMLSVCAAVFIIVAIPIILFMAVNMLGMPEIDLGFMSVPKLISGRYNTTVTVLSGNFFENVGKNLSAFLKIVFSQNDGLIWNAISGFGTIYIFSLPFMLLGIIVFFVGAWKRRKSFSPDFILVAMTASMLVLAIMSSLNINRANFIFIPLTFFTAYGVLFVIKNIKQSLIPVLAVYLVAFACFGIYYFTDYQPQIGYHFSYGYEDAIKYTDSHSSGNIYSTNTINAPYIKTMFYLKTDPQVFLDTVDYPNPDSQCRLVNSFDRYYTGIPVPLPEGDDNAYIFSNYEYYQRTDFDKNEYETKVFGNYTVAIKKK